MFKIILLFIYFTVNAFGFTVPADDPTRFVTDFPIYVDGDVGFIELALNGAAMLTQDQDFKNITELAIFIAVIIGGWVSFRTASMASLVKFTAIGSAGLGMMFAPSVTHIIDERSNVLIQGLNYTQVANVPYLIALPASLTSNLGSPVRDLVYTATIPITYPEVATISTHAIGPQSQIKEIFKSVAQGANLTDSSNATVTGYNAIYKAYVNQCVLGFEVEGKYNAGEILKRSKSGILESIKPSNLIKNDAVALDTLENTGIIFDSNTSFTCQTAWEHLNSNQGAITNLLLPDVKKFLPPKIDLEAIMPGMVAAGYWTVLDETNGTTLMTQAQNYIFNLASQQLIADAALERAGDGVRIAQDITTAKSKALMQMEGTGGLNFFVEMLPNSLHFIYAIVLFLGVFVGVSALAQPAMALTIYKGYFLSFVSFELVKVSQVIISNMTLYYSSTGAASKLAALNGNSASVNSLSASYDYLATMTAISGTIGTMFILAIPAIIYRGDFFGFLSSAAAAPGGKYLGNNLQTATEAAALKQGGDIAMDNLRKDEVAMRRLKQLFGNDFVPNMGAAEYYNQIQSQMSRVSQNAVAMENMGTVGDQSKAVMAQAQKQISANAQLGATVTNQQATDSGIVAGAGMAGAMKGDSNLLNRADGGVSLLEQAAKTSTIEKGVSSMQHSQNISSQFGGSDLSGYVGGTDNNKLNDLGNQISKEQKALGKYNSSPKLEALQKEFDKELAKGQEMSLAQMTSNNDNSQLTGQIGGAQGYQNMMNQSGGAGAGFSKLQEAARVNSLAGMVKSVASTEKMTDKWGGNLADEVKGVTFVTEGESSKEDVAGLLKKKKKGAITTNSDKLNAGVADGSITKQDLEAIEKNYGNALSDYDKKEIGALKAKAKVGTRSEKESTDFAEAQGLVAQKEQDGLAGQAFGIKANYGVNPNMYQQNAQYSEMSQQQTTNAKIQTQGGVNSAVGFDVRDSTIKASGQMGSIEGTEKAFKDVGKELVEGLRQVTRELTENAKKGEIGQSQGLDYTQSKKGENFAVKTGQSSAENQAFGALAAIGQAGGVHALAGLEAVKSAAGVSGLQGSIKGAGGAGKYIKQAFRVADAQSQATAGEIATADIFGGGYENYKRNQAIQNTTQSATSVLELQKNLDDQNFLQNKMDSLQKADPELKLDTFKDKDGKWKTGLNHLSAVSASQVRKSTMKDSFVDDSGKTIDLALGTDGTVNKLSVDGQQKIVDGQTKDMGYNMQAVAEAWNLKNVNDAGMQVQYDEKSGQFKGSQKALKGFGAYYDQVKKAGEGLKEIPAELVVQTGDAAVAGAEMVGADAVASHLEEHGAKYGVGIGGAFLANKIMGNPAGKLRDKLGGLKKSSADKSLNKSDDSSQSQESDKTVKNSDTHVNSLNDIDNINTNIEKNQTEFKATSSKMKSLEKAEQGLQSSISKQEANLKALKDSGAPATRITEAEERLAQTVEKHDGIQSNLNETREKMTSLANEFDNLQGSKFDAEKAFLNTETPKSNPTMMQRASEAFGDNFAKGFTVDNLKAVGKASLPALAVEAGAQGMQYVANNTTGNTQKVAQVGVDAMNSDTAQYAATGGMIGAAIGGVAGFFGGFGAGALPGMAAGATIGTNLGATVGLLKDSLDGSLQAGNQNIRNGFNGLMNMASDFGSSVSNSINQGFNSATNQLSNIDVSQSFGNFMNNMGFGNSNISSAASSALYSQPSSFQGVNMMNSSMMPQMTQQNNEPGKGGVFDPTTTLSGMQNMAHTQNQQMASQMIQGEVYNASGQIDMVKNMLDKLVKNPPNVSQEDVENLKKQQAYIRAQMN